MFMAAHRVDEFLHHFVQQLRLLAMHPRCVQVDAFRITHFLHLVQLNWSFIAQGVHIWRLLFASKHQFPKTSALFS